MLEWNSKQVTKANSRFCCMYLAEHLWCMHNLWLTHIHMKNARQNGGGGDGGNVLYLN